MRKKNFSKWLTFSFSQTNIKGNKGQQLNALKKWNKKINRLDAIFQGLLDKWLTCNDHNILLVIFSFCVQTELWSVKLILFCCQKKKKKKSWTKNPKACATRFHLIKANNLSNKNLEEQGVEGGEKAEKLPKINENPEKLVECCLLVLCFPIPLARGRDWLKRLWTMTTHTMGSTVIKERAVLQYLPARSVPCCNY